RSGSSSSSPQHLTAVGSTLYFSANDGTNEVELWKSDGTASGTVLVKDIRSGSSSSSPQHLTAVGSTIFFAATDGTNGMELWKSDGTASGTVLVKDIYSGGSSSSPQHLTAVGSTLYFIANDGTNGDELWKSDGTSSGTVMVKDIYSGSGGGAPSSLTAIGNTLYFRANDWINGAELWKSDGTASGTVMVKDINSGSNGGNPGFLTAVGSTLYFTASDGTNGSELWKSDGTASGTVMVKNIRIGTSSGNPTNLKAVGSTLYFTASDGTNGTELWKSDGTASGTVMVKDIYSGYLSSSPIRLTAVGSTLYFIANDGTNGYELWKSDGTSVGTVMVKDIWSGSSSTSPHHLTAVGNTLFFQATDGTNGYELWKSDGTASGTVMAIDINSGGNSFPSYLTAVGNTLYFRASEGTNGNELWALDPANITGLSGGSGSGSGGGMTDVTGASCSVSPALPTGLSIDSNTCTISGTPTAETSNTTYTVTAVISGVTYQGSVWLSSSYLELTPSAEGADLYLDVPMTNVTFEYDVSAASGSSTGSGSGASTSSAFAYANDKLATGSFHTCAILDNGDLKCWGRDDQGQLGDGGTTHSYTTHTTSPPAIVIDLGTGRTAVAVDIGEKHTCAILDNGDLKCWGRDNHGALGNGGSKTDTYAPSTTAIDLGTGRTAVAVSCGIDHTCALLDNGEIKCWGLDDKGQLGDGGTSTSLTHTTSPSTPVNLGTGRTAVAVSAGHSHTCAILDNGDVKCWGNNIKGQLGIGNTTNMGVRPGDMGDNLNTVDLGTGRTAVAVYGGYLHTCAILDNGDLKCWGSDQYGELGDGGSTHTSSTYTTSPSAIPIDLGPGRTAVAVHAESHTCALLDNGDVKCWGWDYKGQLGDGGSNSDRAAPPSTPIDLGSGRTAVSVSAGVYHSCAILDNGDIKCWGGDGYGQLGDGGSNSDQSSPVSVSGSNTWDSSTGLIIGVTGATCSISPSLPTGLSIDSSTCTISGTPTVETSNTTYTVTAVISGVTYQGSVWLSTSPYGNITSTVEGAHLNLGEAMTPITLNYTVNANASSGSSGGSGSGSGSGSSTSSTSSFVYANDKISSGGQHTCAILDNGEMKCWGMNTYGQLGIGFNIGGVSSNGNHLQPPSITIDFGTGRTPVKVSSGGLHACALLDNDDVKCWGSRGEGRLGIGGS
ncbi:MAG: ELWxxDGT repeat protein, partial [Candidatus Poseidoniaceae archaeon]